MRDSVKNTLFLCPSGISALQKFRRDEPDNAAVEKKLKDFFSRADDKALMEKSAEMNSLFHMGVKSGDRVTLLSSDTDECEMVSNLIAKALVKRRGCEADVKKIKGLQTADRKKFDIEGVTNLTETILDEVENRRWRYNIVLNATAGFKAVVPYLTFIGMIFHLPILYLFEGSDSVIELPPIPIEFDRDRLKRLEPVIGRLISDYMAVDEFRELTGLEHEETMQYASDILLLEDGFVTLRPTGRILYKRYLQTKGYKIYLAPTVIEKLGSCAYDRKTFESIFKKMRDPVHLAGKLHPEVKAKGRIDLECYKAGATSERLFYYIEGKNVRICDIYMHDEYDRLVSDGSLLREKFKNLKFEEFTCDTD